MIDWEKEGKGFNPTKLLLFRYGLVHGNNFLKANDIPLTHLRINLREHATGIAKTRRYLGYCKYDSRTKIHEINVFLAPCVSPPRCPGFSWSYPGNRADVTPYGVFLHELGHFIHDYLKLGRYCKLPAKECVTSYEDNVDERFAESLRLFIGNPDLLKQLCPERHAQLSKRLKPIIDLPWQEVLKHAHPKFIRAIENRIKNKH